MDFKKIANKLSADAKDNRLSQESYLLLKIIEAISIGDLSIIENLKPLVESEDELNFLNSLSNATDSIHSKLHVDYHIINNEDLYYRKFTLTPSPANNSLMVADIIKGYALQEGKHFEVIEGYFSWEGGDFSWLGSFLSVGDTLRLQYHIPIQ